MTFSLPTDNSWLPCKPVKSWALHWLSAKAVMSSCVVWFGGDVPGRLLSLPMHPTYACIPPHFPPLYCLSAAFSLSSMEMLRCDWVWTLAPLYRINQTTGSVRALKGERWGSKSLEVWSKFRSLFHFRALVTCGKWSSLSRSTVKTQMTNFI